MTNPLTPLFSIFLCIVCIGGWFTHVFECLKNEDFLLLIIGALLFPIGVIHGIFLWLGFL